LKERAVPIIPVEQDEKTEVNPDVAVIYSVSPTLIPVGFSNYTLLVYTSSYLYNMELCCVFGTLGSVVTNATTSSYYAYCPVPQVTFRTYEQGYLAQCSDLTVPFSSTFYVSFYSGLPQISASSVPSVLSAVGGQNITVTLANLPLVSSYDALTYSAKFINSYVSLTGEVNGNSFTFSTISLPIGSDSFVVNVYLNNSYITTPPFTVTVHSVRIEDFSPTSACSIGNSAVSLTINAQVPQSAYLPLCQFTADYYGDDADETPKVLTTLAAYNASGQLTCQTPAWSASTTLATLQLIDPYERTIISNPVSFSFYTECINQLDTPNVCVIGGFPVYLGGTGLPSGNTYYYSYAYVYADANLTKLITSNTFYYVNSSTGYYLPGTAEYNYATTYVQVGTYYTKYSPVFEVGHTNSCLASVYPKSFSADGGDTITLEIVGQFYSGYSSYSYSCLFVDPENYHISQPATIASNTTITCITPPVSESGYGTVALSAAAYPTAHTTSSITVHYT